VKALLRRLAARRAQLGQRQVVLRGLREQLAEADRRLGGLRAAAQTADRTLAQQLVGAYEGARPNLISVVIGSRGFNDLLDRITFVERITIQNGHVLGRVRAARRAVAAEACTLGTLSVRTQVAAGQLRTARNRMTAEQVELLTRELAAAKAEAVGGGELASAQALVTKLTRELESLRSAISSPPTALSSPPAARTAAPASSTAAAAPPAFPMPSDEVAPSATWSTGQGVNIAAPAGTPELAVCTGTIVLHGIGGLGPWTPVLHCDHPIAGQSFVYYGFAGPADLAPIATDVTRGLTIAQVGPGTIATSSGPHLEIGFADASGTPLGHAYATRLLPLLRAADAS